MSEPIPMLIICPVCFTQHIDEGEFATKPHRSHACQECGLIWRPAPVPTIGVRFQPGCKNETDERIYPCDKCGLMRSKAEGGTTFTVCDDCWNQES